MISSDIGKEAIKKELPLIPKLPGVYRMLNEKNNYNISNNWWGPHGRVYASIYKFL